LHKFIAGKLDMPDFENLAYLKFNNYFYSVHFIRGI
jgi:hypothetical protein